MRTAPAGGEAYGSATPRNVALRNLAGQMSIRGKQKQSKEK
jgi:hypothetical protein